MNKTTPILTAVMSNLVSERDKILAQLDLVINKNISDSGVSGIVEETTELFKKLSNVESTIQTVNYTIHGNEEPKYSDDVNRLVETLLKLQEQGNSIKTKEDGNNS